MALQTSSIVLQQGSEDEDVAHLLHFTNDLTQLHQKVKDKLDIIFDGIKQTFTKEAEDVPKAGPSELEVLQAELTYERQVFTHNSQLTS